MKEEIELKRAELKILEDIVQTDFCALPTDTLCRVSDSLKDLASGEGYKRYFKAKRADGALIFYTEGNDSKTYENVTDYKYVQVLGGLPIDFREWINLHRLKGTNTLHFELHQFPENLPANYSTILEEETVE